MFDAQKVIEDAIARKMAVNFVYQKADKSVSDRTIVPSQIATAANGTISVFGYDLGREGLRRFRVDRILGEPVVVQKPGKGYDSELFEIEEIA